MCVLILRCRSPGLSDRAEGGCQAYTLIPFDYHVHTLKHLLVSINACIYVSAFHHVLLELVILAWRVSVANLAQAVFD